jgi:GTP-binding protein
MPPPVVAIVGRPNVGKSSLFNMLAGRRISIVDPTAGVTRDRVSTVLELDGRHVELVDTGGMGIQDHESARVVLFVVDVRDGVVPLDQTVAERLRGIGKPVVFVANKADEERLDVRASDLYRLGYGDPLLVSANSKRGRDELISAVLERLPVDAHTVAPGPVELKLAIVGRRNVGKSTFINALAAEERVIVSEVPGTTRDSVDVRFERDGKAFIAIDTAGVRKRGSLASDIEYYSLHRAERSIRRADVVLHFFDARLRIGRVDKQLAEYVVENHKPCIFVVNKWDLVRHAMETERMADYVRAVFPMLDFVPIAFVTAKKGKNTLRLLNLAQQLHKQAGRRIGTGELNRIIAHAIELNAPPVRLNKQGRVYYAAQVGVHPPTVALVTNGPDLFDNTYQKYLLKTLRDAGRFGEVPIKLVLREKGEGKGGPADDVVDLATAVEPPLDDATDELPGLADEPVADEPTLPPPPASGGRKSPGDASPRREQPPEPEQRADAPRSPKPAPKPAAEKPKRRRPGPGTWNI